MSHAVIWSKNIPGRGMPGTCLPPDCLAQPWNHEEVMWESRVREGDGACGIGRLRKGLRVSQEGLW